MKQGESRFLQYLPTLLTLISQANATATATSLDDQYSASFQVPAIQLNKTTSIAYQVNLTLDGHESALSTSPILNIALCQSTKTLVTQNTSWNVLNLLNNICFRTPSSSSATCKNNPYNGRGSLHLNLTQDDAFNSTGDDTLKNFFFCFSHSNSSILTVCDYSSSLFHIYPSVPESKPVDPDTLTSMPTFFPTPTHLALTITSTRSTILQSQTPTVTSPSIVTQLQKKKKNNSALVTNIGIGFGILALFLLTGLITLFFFHRSGARKRAQTRGLLIHEPLSQSDSKPEGNHEKLPTSPTWEFFQPNNPNVQESPIADLGTSKLQPVLSHGRNSIVSQITAHSKVSTLDDGSNFGRSSLNMNDDYYDSNNIIISPYTSYQYQPFLEYRDRDELDLSDTICMSSTSPFLKEEGMSAEEMAKLENEERRIDAAIAAAEAKKLYNRR